jgi:hypothetical protein
MAGEFELIERHFGDAARKDVLQGSATTPR